MRWVESGLLGEGSDLLRNIKRAIRVELHVKHLKFT